MCIRDSQRTIQGGPIERTNTDYIGPGKFPKVEIVNVKSYVCNLVEPKMKRCLDQTFLHFES